MACELEQTTYQEQVAATQQSFAAEDAAAMAKTQALEAELAAQQALATATAAVVQTQEQYDAAVDAANEQTALLHQRHIELVQCWRDNNMPIQALTLPMRSKRRG